jgi:hypothetical protein
MRLKEAGHVIAIPCGVEGKASLSFRSLETVHVECSIVDRKSDGLIVAKIEVDSDSPEITVWADHESFLTKNGKQYVSLCVCGLGDKAGAELDGAAQVMLAGYHCALQDPCSVPAWWLAGHRLIDPFGPTE